MSWLPSDGRSIRSSCPQHRDTPRSILAASTSPTRAPVASCLKDKGGCRPQLVLEPFADVTDRCTWANPVPYKEVRHLLRSGASRSLQEAKRWWPGSSLVSRFEIKSLACSGGLRLTDTVFGRGVPRHTFRWSKLASTSMRAAACWDSCRLICRQLLKRLVLLDRRQLRAGLQSRSSSGNRRDHPKCDPGIARGQLCCGHRHASRIH